MFRELFPDVAKPIFRPMDRRWRQHLLKVELHRLGGRISQRRMRRLSLGWANDGWEADGRYLAMVARLARAADGPVLECGSGISTVVLGEFTRQPVVSLEHDEYWVERMNSVLAARGLRESVHHAPLHDYGSYEWYDVRGITFPAAFSLVICDGPPSGPTTGGRYGLVPVMKDTLKRAPILLDDGDRVSERETIERWANEFGMEVRQAGKHVLLYPGRVG